MILQALRPLAALEVCFSHPTPKTGNPQSFPQNTRIEAHPKPLSEQLENSPLTIFINHVWGGVHDPPSPSPKILRLKPHCSHPTPAVGRIFSVNHTARNHRPSLPPPRLSQVALFDQNCCPWAEYVALAFRTSCRTWCCPTNSIQNKAGLAQGVGKGYTEINRNMKK